MDVRLKTYKKDFHYSYAFGVFATLELLQNRPELVLKILTHSRGTDNAGVDKIRALCLQHDIAVEQADKAVERLGKRGDTYAIGVFEKATHPLNAAVNHLVLVNPSNTGNLGTVLRTMLGFGYANLGLIPPAVDIYDPRVVRASMGALFQINFATFERFEDYQAAFPSHAVYPFMTDGSISLAQATFEQPHTLVFGNESAGLPDAYHNVGMAVSIPQHDAIDSLNLAVAVGIGLYASSSMAGHPA
jgi:TrmH family RNA methyltransferase